jgi:uncharacterized protein
MRMQTPAQRFATLLCRWLLLVIGLTLLVGTVGWAQSLLPIPTLNAHVVDTTDTLNAAQRTALNTKLIAFEASSGSQVVVLMVATTQPEDIASFANRVGNTWKIGRKGIGDGLLLIVAKDDHQLRMEVAKTLEGAIPDLAAKRVIDQFITPRFKQGDFAGGLDAGVNQIMALIRGEALPAPSQATVNPTDTGGRWIDFAVSIFFAVTVGGSIARRVLGNRLGSLVAGLGVGALALFVTSSILIAFLAGLAGLVFTLLGSLARGVQGLGGGHWGGGMGSGRGGWGSGSTGGGGFSSGGGGDFGGGGASGRW